MIPVLLILAVAYWLAAPDPATAGARTAAGAGVRAGGAGARQHWASGREQRRGRRTGRRGRWDGRVQGATPHPWLLRGDRALTWLWGSTKSAAGITRAAAAPVPAAVKAGWVQGRDRHRAKAGGRPAGLTLDPPWWRGVQPQVQDAGAGGEQVQVQPGDSPEVQVGNSPGEQVPTTAHGHDLPPEFKPGDELVDGTGKPWTVTGVRPQIDADTYDLVDSDGAPGYADIPRPDRWSAITEQDDPTDPPAGTSPAGPPAIPTEGAPPVSVNMPSEINDLTTLHGFAQAVIDDAEENGPGSTYAAAAASISEYFGRDFGREVNGTASAFEEAAAAYNQAWQAMLEAAEGMKNESLAAIGG